jgi:hypothetical protein
MSCSCRTCLLSLTGFGRASQSSRSGHRSRACPGSVGQVLHRQHESEVHFAGAARRRITLVLRRTADGRAANGYGAGRSSAARAATPGAGRRTTTRTKTVTAMTLPTPKPDPETAQTLTIEEQGEPSATDIPSSGKIPAGEARTGKSSTSKPRAAQEDRLAAALRANLARRKAATRAARQGMRDEGRQVERASGDDDAEA